MSAATMTRPGTAGPEDQQRPRRRRRLGRIIALVLVIALLGAAGWVVYGSTTFSTDQVVVHGEDQVSDDAVLAAVAVPLGRPLARQDVDAIARRAITLPAVRSATVTRTWPHTLTITVVERQPVLGVRQPDGYVVVDGDGVAYRQSATLPAGALAADVDPDNLDVLSQVGRVASALPRSLAKQVTTVAATSENDITLSLDSGIVVRWGGADDTDLKAQVALALLKQHPKALVDVSSPHNPAMR